MTYVREVTETDFYNCMCLYFQFDSICVFSKFVELVNLLSWQFIVFKAGIYFAATSIFLTSYSNVDAVAGYTSYPLSMRTVSGRQRASNSVTWYNNVILSSSNMADQARKKNHPFSFNFMQNLVKISFKWFQEYFFELKSMFPCPSSLCK